MKNKYYASLVATLLLFPTLVFGQSLDNHALSYYCGNDKVEFEKRVTVGKGTRVHLNEGAFYQVEQNGEYDATLDFINNQVVSSGVNEDCAEFLLTNGLLQSVNDGDVIARVYFDFNQSTLTDKSKYILGNIVNLLKVNGKHLELEGHTDSIGTHEYNFSLGLKRSDAVEKYLVQHGVAEDRVTTSSFGETQPIAKNSDSAGRQQNRRVEIK